MYTTCTTGDRIPFSPYCPLLGIRNVGRTEQGEGERARCARQRPEAGRKECTRRARLETESPSLRIAPLLAIRNVGRADYTATFFKTLSMSSGPMQENSFKPCQVRKEATVD